MGTHYYYPSIFRTKPRLDRLKGFGRRQIIRVLIYDGTMRVRLYHNFGPREVM